MMTRPTLLAGWIAGESRNRRGLALIIIAAMSAAPAATLAAVSQSDLIGRWITPGGDTVAFRSCIDQVSVASICGNIVKVNDATDPPRRDSRNPRAANRSAPILGLEIVRGLTESTPGVWTGGTLYNPDDGRTYRGAIRMQGRDSLELRGCAVVVICQSQTWRRARP